MRKAGIALAGILIFAFFTGCAHTAGDVAMASASPVLDRIVERGEIRVGTAGTMPPLNMTTRDGEVIGLEPDIAALAADSMGVKLKLVTMPFSELLPSLEQGKIDMILSGMTVTLERNMKVAFVGPYMKSGKAFLSKIKTIASADDTTELNSPRIKLAALKGSTSQRFVEAVLPKASLVTISDYDQGVNMVLRDEVHAMVADFPICVVSVVRYPDSGLVSVITPLTYEPLGIAVPADDPLFMNWTENFLKLLEGSGALERLEERWLKNASWLEKLP